MAIDIGYDYKCVSPGNFKMNGNTFDNTITYVDKKLRYFGKMVSHDASRSTIVN